MAAAAALCAAEKRGDQDRTMSLLSTLANRAFLTAVWLTQRATIGARGILVDDAGQILLVRHTYRPGWDFPGGGVRPPETLAECAAREVLEETGYLLTGTPRLVDIYAVRGPGAGRDYVAVFLCREFVLEQGKRSAEIAEVRWFPADALPDDAEHSNRARLDEALGRRPSTSVW